MAALDELIGESPAIVAVRETIRGVLRRHGDARRLPPILLLGETGTGKGLVARGIHRASARAFGAFVDVNCAAIPDTLLEAEMFGFERGAFTDARQAKAGLFQVADGGTIFLDEIGLLPEPLQSKLLKVIEERTVRRLGSTRSDPVDVWIIAGTNEDLAAATRGPRFREDLYHRLAVLTIELPPLRGRGDDVVRLAEHFLARACADYGLPPKTLGGDARRALLAYAWPGNVRELGNVMERVALLGEGRVVTEPMLGLPVGSAPMAGEVVAERPVAPTAGDERAERDQLLLALRATGWNVSRAAAHLGITRNTIRYRIEKYQLSRDVAEGLPVSVLGPASPGAAVPVPSPMGLAAPSASPAGATSLPAAGTDQTPGVGPIRWERRRLTLMRAEVATAGSEEGLQASRDLDTVVEKLSTFGGRIEELGRTGIFAVFGLEPAEDASRRAALAAMAMMNAIGRGAPPTLKVAIHVDQYLVARVRRMSSIDHSAKRQAAAVLDGLLAHGEGGVIVVSETAAAFLERGFELVPLPTPPGARRLVGRERTGPGAAGRMAPFVGRERELALLRSRFESAQHGRGQVIGIVGDPGIGKSRLLFEFRQALTEHRVSYLEGRCLSYASAIPYLPVLEILRTICRIADADGHEAITEKILSALVDTGLDPAERGPYLLHLLGVKDDGSGGLEALDPGVIKRRLFETLRQLTVRQSQRAPLIIVVDDLHWVDRASEEYLASLVETTPGAAILFMSTYRPGYRPPWMDRSYATQLALPPLAPPDSGNLVRAVAEPDAIPESVVDLILSRGEGNPFFLEELTRAVREQPGSRPLTVPGTVEEVLLARIDRLAPEEKSLLQAAAVIGKTSPVALLRTITGLSDDDLAGRLRSLQTSEFLYESGFGAEHECTFKHALTQEVAYTSLLPAERQALHARIVDTLEHLHAERVPEQVDRLAHHAFRAESWDKAVTYLRQAGRKAAARSANREAVAYFERALEALTHLPGSAETVRSGIEVRFDLRSALLPLGEFGRIFDNLRDAEALAETLGDQRWLGRLFAYMTNYVSLMGEQSHALDYGQRALAIAATLGDSAIQVETNVRLGQIYHTLGDFRRAIGILRESLQFLEAGLVHERFGLAVILSVLAGNWLIASLAEVGEFAEGIARGDDAIRVAEAVGQPIDMVVAAQAVGLLHLRRGEVPGAVSVLERAIELCRTWNIRVWFPRVASTLGSAYALAGRGAEALVVLDEAAERQPSVGRLGGHALRLAEGYLLAGRTDHAVRFATQAIELSRAHGERGHEAWALRLFGEIASRSGSSDVEAIESIRRSLALAEELGMRPLAARCHVELAGLARRGTP